MTEPAVEQLPEVAASEHDLIVMARALVAPQSQDVFALLTRPRVLPSAISPAAAELVRDALRQVWPSLWRRNGAKPDTAIIQGKAVRGRGWERHAPVALEFSPVTLRFLRWLIASPLSAAFQTIQKLPAGPLSIGDQVVIYLALDAARDTAAQGLLAQQPMVRAAPLAWLGFAHVLGGAPSDVAFDSLVAGPGAVVVEALTPELARRWHAVELAKRAMTDPAELLALGAVQDATLGAFMTACDRAHRRDLASFVIDAATPMIARGLSPAPLTVDPDAPLSVRASARLAAGALLRAVIAWNAWDQQHRGVHFIDDDYGASQVMLGRFERIGAAGVDRATAWLADLASLAPTPGPASATIGAR